MSEATARPRWLPYALCVVVLAGTAAGRAVVESSRELQAGEQALARGEVPEAVRRLRRAAHWYVPGNPYCSQSFERLENIATQAESQGRTEHALLAWRAVRASALASRWLTIPQRARLERANRHLASLLSELPPPPEDRGKERSRLREEHLALLMEDRAPEPAWLLVMALGVALWLGASLWAARSGWDEQERPQWRALSIAGGIIVAGFSLFLLAASRA